MRQMLVLAGFGLTAWLSACEGQRFQSCDEAGSVCGLASNAAASSAPAEPGGSPSAAPPAIPDPVVTPSQSAGSANPVPPTPSQGEASTEGLSPAPSALDAGTNEGSSATRSMASDGTSGEVTETEASSEANPPSEPAPVQWGESLLTNGDFSNRGNSWDVSRSGGAVLVNADYSDEALCVSSRTSAHVAAGWPANAERSLDLPPGHYRFSYRARGEGITVRAKVGHAYEPYNAVFEADWSGPDADWHDVVHEFTFDGDDAVGLVFNADLDNETLCIDDVELRQELPPVVDAAVP